MADRYVTLFDWEGVETVINATRFRNDTAYKVMMGENPGQTIEEIVSMLKLRARFNEHRHPEIWLFDVEDSLSEEDVQEFAQEHPQEFADFVRINGESLAIPRIPKAERKIV